MPYRFKIDEPVEKGFRRIAREQLDAALTELAHAEVQPGGIHECRKALKRLRALVRLAAPALGKDESRKRSKALGSIARLLSERRDQAVMIETVAKLATGGGPEAALVLAPLNTHFVKQVGEAPKSLDADRAAQARALLLREARKFSRAKFRRRGIAALEGGLSTSYRHARKELKHAYAEPTDETFHALRKAVQWHWRQMSLLARAWPEEFAVRVAAARELSQMLGDDHDIAMLLAAVASAPDISAEQKEAIAELCLRRQRALRAAAEYRARRLFAEAPKAFTERMTAYWRYGRIVEPLFDAAPAAHPARPIAQPDLRPAGQEPKPVRAKPTLAAKSAGSAPSQRRA